MSCAGGCSEKMSETNFPLRAARRPQGRAEIKTSYHVAEPSTGAKRPPPAWSQVRPASRPPLQNGVLLCFQAPPVPHRGLPQAFLVADRLLDFTVEPREPTAASGPTRAAPDGRSRRRHRRHRAGQSLRARDAQHQGLRDHGARAGRPLAPRGVAAASPGRANPRNCLNPPRAPRRGTGGCARWSGCRTAGRGGRPRRSCRHRRSRPGPRTLWRSPSGG
jgi:hypothetical protein